MAGAELPVKHLVLEMRYPPSLAFYTAMDRIGLDLSDSYPNWERSPLTLEIRNKKLRRRCYLSFQRCFYEAIGFAAVHSEVQRASKFFDKMHHELKFTNVHRIGLRQRLAVTSSEPFTEMVQRTVKKFQPPDEPLTDLLRGSIEDVGYNVDVLADNGWKYHLRFGPMEREQWFEVIPHEVSLFESAEEFANYKEGFPDRYFYIDIDCYQNDTTYSDLVSLLTSMDSISSEILGDLVQHLKG